MANEDSTQIPENGQEESDNEIVELTASQRVEPLNIVALVEIFAECLTEKEISKILSILSMVSSTLGFILIQRGELKPFYLDRDAQDIADDTVDDITDDIIDEISEEEII